MELLWIELIKLLIVKVTSRAVATEWVSKGWSKSSQRPTRMLTSCRSRAHRSSHRSNLCRCLFHSNLNCRSNRFPCNRSHSLSYFHSITVINCVEIYRGFEHDITWIQYYPLASDQFHNHFHSSRSRPKRFPSVLLDFQIAFSRWRPDSSRSVALHLRRLMKTIRWERGRHCEQHSQIFKEFDILFTYIYSCKHLFFVKKNLSWKQLFF